MSSSPKRPDVVGHRHQDAERRLGAADHHAGAAVQAERAADLGREAASPPPSRRPPPGAAGAACSRRTTPRRRAARAASPAPSTAPGRAGPARGRPGRARRRRRAGRRASAAAAPVTCTISSWIGASPSATRSSSATTCCWVVARASSLMSCAKPCSTSPSPPRLTRSPQTRSVRTVPSGWGTSWRKSSDSPAAIARRPSSRIASDSSRSRAVHPVSWSSSGDWTATPDCGQTTHQPMRAIRCASASARSLSRRAASVRACSVTSTASTAARRRPSCSSGRADADEAAPAGPVQLAARHRPAAGEHLAGELGDARPRRPARRTRSIGSPSAATSAKPTGAPAARPSTRAVAANSSSGAMASFYPVTMALRGPPRDTWRAGRRGRARADGRLPGPGQALAPRPGRGRGGGAADGRDQRRVRPAAGRDRPARPRGAAAEAAQRARELAAGADPACARARAARRARPVRGGPARDAGQHVGEPAGGARGHRAAAAVAARRRPRRPRALSSRSATSPACRCACGGAAPRSACGPPADGATASPTCGRRRRR